MVEVTAAAGAADEEFKRDNKQKKMKNDLQKKTLRPKSMYLKRKGISKNQKELNNGRN